VIADDSDSRLLSGEVAAGESCWSVWVTLELELVLSSSSCYKMSSKKKSAKAKAEAKRERKARQKELEKQLFKRTGPDGELRDELDAAIRNNDEAGARLIIEKGTKLIAELKAKQKKLTEDRLAKEEEDDDPAAAPKPGPEIPQHPDGAVEEALMRVGMTASGGSGAGEDGAAGVHNPIAARSQAAWDNFKASDMCPANFLTLPEPEQLEVYGKYAKRREQQRQNLELARTCELTLPDPKNPPELVPPPASQPESLAEIMERDKATQSVNDLQSVLQGRLTNAEQANAQVSNNMKGMKQTEQTLDNLEDKLRQGKLTPAGQRAVERRIRSMKKMAADQQKFEKKTHDNSMLLDMAAEGSPTGAVMEMLIGPVLPLFKGLCLAARIRGTEDSIDLNSGTPEGRQCWLKVCEGMNRLGVLATDPTAWKTGKSHGRNCNTPLFRLRYGQKR
jgi:hypothetical protein